MNSPLAINPQRPIEGAPITVITENASPGSHLAVVRRVNGQPEWAFDLPIKVSRDGKGEGQFAISEAGLYQIEIGDLRLPFEVIQARNISVLSELGLVAALVLALTAGVIGWTQKKKSQS